MSINLHSQNASKKLSHMPQNRQKIFLVGNLILNDSTSITIWFADINIDVDDIEV